MGRSQCIVTRGNRILMMKHRQGGNDWWCLPGGGIEPGETPAQAALRELQEECGVGGVIVRPTSVYADPNCDDAAYTLLVDIGDQTPVIGSDPEYGSEQVIADMRWLTLPEICERDRAFLWAAGLIAVPEFAAELLTWSDDISYPGTRP
jgi:ADP-ribose pyrophosphatase YjhB (NUDIX family)